MRSSDWSSDVCSSDLFHREGGAYIGEPDRTDDAPIDRVIGGHVLDPELEQIVDVAGHAVEFDDLRNIADCRIEHLEPGFAMLGSAQAHEDRKVETERTGVEDRDAPRDHSAFPAPLNPPPASILRHIGLEIGRAHV